MERPALKPLLALLICAWLTTCLAAAVNAESSSAEHAKEEARLRELLHDPTNRAALLESDASHDIRILNAAAHPDDEDGSSLTLLRRRYGYRTHILYTTRGEGGQNEIGNELGDRLGVIRSMECQRAATGYGASISFLNALDFGFAKTAREALDRWGEEEMVQRIMAELQQLRPHIVLTHHTPDTGHGHHRATSILYREAIRRLIAAADPAAPLLYMERDNRQGDSIRLDANQALPHGNWSAMQWAHVALRRHRSQGMALRPPSPDAGRKDYRPVIHQLDPKALDVWKLSTDAWAPEQLASLLGVAIDEDRDAAALRLQAQRLRAKTAPLFRAGPWLAVQNGWERSLQSTLPAGSFQLLDAPSPWKVQQLGDGTKIRILARSHSASAAYPSHDTLREHRTLADSLSFALSIDADTRIEFRLALPRLAPNTLELASDLPIAIAGQASSVRLRWWGGAEPIGLSAMSTQSVNWEQEPWRESGPGSFERNLVVQVDANASDPVRFQIVGKDVSESFDLRLQSIADTRQTRIGFISGADGSSAEALRAIGMTVSDLDAATLERGDLSIFDVILLDIRAYLENEALRENNARLLSWVRGGGHLVVQYQKVFEWNPDRGNPVFAPLELLLGHGRVVDESAAPKFLQPKHPFFHYPHPLDADSFDGWVQERGLYFPEQWDPRFADLLAFADPTEEEQSGCLLTAAIGEGHYTYSSLVWYRQLRAGIPGAYQAFVNLLLWPQAPHSLEP